MDALVIGRSLLFGKPAAQLLLAANATVTMAHSKTRDLPALARRADILVAAIGRPEFVKGDWVKPGATVIDVGINRVEAGDGQDKIVGDVDYEAAAKNAGAITPVPGGVGAMTIVCLMRNTLIAACAQTGWRFRRSDALFHRVFDAAARSVRAHGLVVIGDEFSVRSHQIDHAGMVDGIAAARRFVRLEIDVVVARDEIDRCHRAGEPDEVRPEGAQIGLQNLRRVARRIDGDEDRHDAASHRPCSLSIASAMTLSVVGQTSGQ